jgi:hypothetical protein
MGFVWLSVLLMAPLEPPKATSILLLPVHPAAPELSDASQTVDDTVLATMREYEGVHLTTTSDVQTMLGLERTKDIMGCDGVSCSAEIAGALNADNVLTGVLRHTGDKWQLSLRLISSRSSQVLGAELGEVRPDDTSRLRTEVRQLISSVLSHIGIDPGASTYLRRAMPPPAAPSSGAYKAVTWAFTGLGVAALGVFTWQGLQARSLYQQESGMSGNDPGLKGVMDRGQSAQRNAEIALGAAAVSAGVAGILWWNLEL